MIGKIQRVPLREVWRHEALNFTTWLVENPDVLSDALGLKLQEIECEQAAGDFSVDLVAKDDEGNVVVIENQLEKSNHDHLGKLVTYAAALSARTAVWVVAEPRPEHIQAITWLNESRLAGFYLLKVEAIRIADSVPAPLLTLITGPSEDAREIGDTKQDIAERYPLRKKFWTTLLERARLRTKLHASTSPSQYGGIVASAGRAGLLWLYSVNQHEATAGLLIDRDAEESKRVFEQLRAHREEVESAFGGPGSPSRCHSTSISESRRSGNRRHVGRCHP